MLLALVAGIAGSCSREARKERYYQNAVRYFEKGDYGSAAIQFRNALRLDPHYADAHYQLAQCYLKQGLVDRAYSELSSTVDLAPRNWKAQIDLGELLFVSRHYDEAGKKARLVLSEDPNNADDTSFCRASPPSGATKSRRWRK